MIDIFSRIFENFSNNLDFSNFDIMYLHANISSKSCLKCFLKSAL